MDREHERTIKFAPVTVRSALRAEAVSTDRALSGPRLLPRGPSPRVAMGIGVTGATQSESALASQ